MEMYGGLSPRKKDIMIEMKASMVEKNRLLKESKAFIWWKYADDEYECFEKDVGCEFKIKNDVRDENRKVRHCMCKKLIINANGYVIERAVALDGGK